MSAVWVVSPPSTRNVDVWDMRDGVRRTNRVTTVRAAHLARPDGRTVCGRQVDPAAGPLDRHGDGETSTRGTLDHCWRCTTIGPDALTHRDVCAAAGITYRQLDHWTRRGWLHPHPWVGGSGHQRTYPPAELAVAVRMGELTRGGLQASVAAQIARQGVDAPTDLALAWSAGRGECA